MGLLLLQMNIVCSTMVVKHVFLSEFSVQKFYPNCICSIGQVLLVYILGIGEILIGFLREKIGLGGVRSMGRNQEKWGLFCSVCLDF